MPRGNESTEWSSKYILLQFQWDRMVEQYYALYNQYVIREQAFEHDKLIEQVNGLIKQCTYISTQFMCSVESLKEFKTISYFQYDPRKQKQGLKLIDNFFEMQKAIVLLQAKLNQKALQQQASKSLLRKKLPFPSVPPIHELLPEKGFIAKDAKGKWLKFEYAQGYGHINKIWIWSNGSPSKNPGWKKIKVTSLDQYLGEDKHYTYGLDLAESGDDISFEKFRCFFTIEKPTGGVESAATFNNGLIYRVKTASGKDEVLPIDIHVDDDSGAGVVSDDGKIVVDTHIDDNGMSHLLSDIERTASNWIAGSPAHTAFTGMRSFDLDDTDREEELESAKQHLSRDIDNFERGGTAPIALGEQKPQADLMRELRETLNKPLIIDSGNIDTSAYDDPSRDAPIEYSEQDDDYIAYSGDEKSDQDRSYFEDEQDDDGLIQTTTDNGISPSWELDGDAAEVGFALLCTEQAERLAYEINNIYDQYQQLKVDLRPLKQQFTNPWLNGVLQKETISKGERRQLDTLLDNLHYQLSMVQKIKDSYAQIAFKLSNSIQGYNYHQDFFGQQLSTSPPFRMNPDILRSQVLRENHQLLETIDRMQELIHKIEKTLADNTVSNGFQLFNANEIRANALPIQIEQDVQLSSRDDKWQCSINGTDTAEHVEKILKQLEQMNNNTDYNDKKRNIIHVRSNLNTLMQVSLHAKAIGIPLTNFKLSIEEECYDEITGLFDSVFDLRYRNKKIQPISFDEIRENINCTNPDFQQKIVTTINQLKLLGFIKQADDELDLHALKSKKTSPDLLYAVTANEQHYQDPDSYDSDESEIFNANLGDISDDSTETHSCDTSTDSPRSIGSFDEECEDGEDYEIIADDGTHGMHKQLEIEAHKRRQKKAIDRIKESKRRKISALKSMINSDTESEGEYNYIGDLACEGSGSDSNQCALFSRSDDEQYNNSDDSEQLEQMDMGSPAIPKYRSQPARVLRQGDSQLFFAQHIPEPRLLNSCSFTQPVEPKKPKVQDTYIQHKNRVFGLQGIESEAKRYGGCRMLKSTSPKATRRLLNRQALTDIVDSNLGPRRSS